MLTVGPPLPGQAPPGLPLPVPLVPDTALPAEGPAGALPDLPILPPAVPSAPQPWAGHLADALAASTVPARAAPLPDESEPFELDADTAGPALLVQPWALSLVPELAQLPAPAEAAPGQAFGNADTPAPVLLVAAARPPASGQLAARPPVAITSADQGVTLPSAAVPVVPASQANALGTQAALPWPQRPISDDVPPAAAAPGGQRPRAWLASLPSVAQPAATAGGASPAELPVAAPVRTLPSRIAWLRAGSLPVPARPVPAAPLPPPLPLPLPPADVMAALPLAAPATGDAAANPALAAPVPPVVPSAILLPPAIDAARPARRNPGDVGAAEALPSPPITAAALPLPPPLLSAAAPAALSSVPPAVLPGAPLPEPALAPTLASTLASTLAIASDRLGAVQVDVTGSPDRLEVSLSATPAAAPILAGEAPRLAQELAAAGVALASYAVNGQRADLAADAANPGAANPGAGNAGGGAGSHGSAAGNGPHRQPSPSASEPARRGSAALRPTAARHTPSPDRFA